MRASLAGEKVGVRSISIVASGFVQLARRTAEVMGVHNLAIAEYPGVIMTEGKEELRDKVENVLVAQIIGGLTSSVKAVEGHVEPAPRDIIFEGTLHEVHELFTRNLWTDGLPIMPPTAEQVEKFLSFTGRSAHEMIGVLGPENREATVWNVAVNGVMAGCRPEYMPILLAVVDAIADPEFCIHEAGGTPGWEPLIILNGPIIEALDFNSEVGVMRVGRQANTSIGRFLRLYMRNVAGLRPGTFDKGTIGCTFNVVLAENENAARELGWEPFSVDQGFQLGDNVVTVQSVRAITFPMYCAGDSAHECAQAIADVFGPTCSYMTHTGLKYRNFYPLLVISPSIAKVLAKDGWTKADLRDYLDEHCKVPCSVVEKWAWRNGHTDFRISKLVEEGKLPKRYAESTDPDRLIPVFFQADQIGIVVSGDPARNQARGYLHNHRPRVSKKVELPKTWAYLLKGLREVSLIGSGPKGRASSAHKDTSK